MNYLKVYREMIEERDNYISDYAGYLFREFIAKKIPTIIEANFKPDVETIEIPMNDVPKFFEEKGYKNINEVIMKVMEYLRRFGFNSQSAHLVINFDELIHKFEGFLQSELYYNDSKFVFDKFIMQEIIPKLVIKGDSENAESVVVSCSYKKTKYNDKTHRKEKETVTFGDRTYEVPFAEDLVFWIKTIPGKILTENKTSFQVEYQIKDLVEFYLNYRKAYSPVYCLPAASEVTHEDEKLTR